MKKRHEETWRRVDLTKGEYMSASKIFKEQGGQPQDLLPTKRLLLKCWSMGGAMGFME